MGTAWSADAARYLLETISCPRCERSPVTGDVCPFCQAQLTGPIADELAAVSARAAAALQERQTLIDRLPTVAPIPIHAATLAPPAGPPRSTTPPGDAGSRPAEERATAQISVQSVLAVAGAGLVAVAALVFSYLNPDFSVAARNTVIGIVTVLFLGGAWMLARRGIRFSAEAIGALGMVFVVLDISAFVEIAPDSATWAFGALGTLVSSVVMLAVAVLVRLRTWLWLSLLGVSITPALFSYGFDEPWAPVIGNLAVGFVAFGMHEALGRLSERFASPLRADRVLAIALRLIVVAVVVLQLVRIDEPSNATRALGSAAIVGALGLLAALSTRHPLASLWSYLAGAFTVIGVALLPLALDLPNGDRHWYLALVPTAAAIAVIAVALVPTPSHVRRPAWPAGALTFAALATLPATLIAIGQDTAVALRLIESRLSFSPPTDPWVLPGSGVIGSEYGPAVILGLTAAALGFAALARGSRLAPATGTDRWRGLASGILTLALWVGTLALSAGATWTALPWAGQLIASLSAAVALSLAVALLPLLRRARLRYRLPLLFGAHALILIGALVAWSLDALSVVGGVGVVVAILVLSRAMPITARAVYIGVAYAYALIVFARGLDLVGLETIIVLCLTTSLAAVIALASTLVRRVPTSWWYAILIVTVVPFLISVVWVINDRPGWTALSTVLIFALALTLVITRRAGLTTLVRAMAAAILIPSIAVVVVCLTSEFLAQSGSPVALPIIATIIACTIAAGRVIQGGLIARGFGDADARAVQITIEVSAFLTGAIAVVLALVLPASGFATTMLVLLILGIGSAAARIFAGRRYGWWVAAACWTGALWCIWALAGVDVVEPYILPPALAAIIIGTILTARGRDGMPLVATGLAAAVAPTLVILAVAGNGDGALLPWRALAMLAASLLLLGVGLLFTRRQGSPVPRLGALRVPVLVVAIAAAAGGAIQAMRIGWDVDPGGFATHDLQMLPVLVYTLAATALAAASGFVLRTGSRWRAADTADRTSRWATTRWLLAPALAFLVIGPISAAGDSAVPMWTLWGLALLVLAIMVVAVLRARVAETALPPVWFVFAAAWCTAVAGWTTRELNVEWFSLPLGLALLACGIIVMAWPPVAAVTRRSLTAWPIGYTGSWWVLAPGIIGTLLASILATGTNPAIWRAIVVLGIALIAILLGSLFRLAAPFIIGLIVLPVENIIVFAVLLSRNESALPWWITLAVAGAVLLAIAVNSERRTASSGGFGARIRDLK